MTSAATLNGWKEIAAFLGRGVRTAQRWERELGLPVHRPKGSTRSAVLAFAEELDTWLHQTPLGSGKANGRSDTRLSADSPAHTLRQEELAASRSSPDHPQGPRTGLPLSPKLTVPGVGVTCALHILGKLAVLPESSMRLGGQRSAD